MSTVPDELLVLAPIEVLPAEILSSILFFVEDKDRLNLRACSKAMENAISQTDLHVFGYGDPEITFNGDFDCFTVHLGCRIMLRTDYDSLDEIKRVRHRLFKRAYSKSVNIRCINFNHVPMNFIENLLEGVGFRVLWFVVRREEYNESVYHFIRKHATKKIKFIMNDYLLEKDKLFDLLPMRDLKAFGDVSWKPDDNTFLDLVRKRHTMLEIPVDILSDETIFEVLKVVTESRKSQWVVFQVEFEMLERFIKLIGLRRTAEGLVKTAMAEDVEIENDEYMEDGLQEEKGFTGEWELTYQGRGHVRMPVNLQNLPPRALSRLLQFLPAKDRLRMRATCKELEEAISQTDLHVCNENRGIVTIMKSDYNGKFNLHFGCWLVFKTEDDDETRQQLLRLRQRLCKRAITNEVHVRYIDYNSIDVNYIVSLIGECEFNLLWINVSPHEYHPSLLELVRKYSSNQVKLIMHDFLLDREVLLSLPRLRQLSAVGQIEAYCNEDFFLDLVKMRHELLEVPLRDLAPESIVEAIKIVAESPHDQHVILHVKSSLIVRFVHLIGLKKVGKEFEEQPDFDHDFTVETYEDDDPFDADAGWPTESFTLRYKKAEVLLSYPLDEEDRTIVICISKYFYSEEEQ